VLSSMQKQAQKLLKSGYFENSFHFRGGRGIMLPALYALPIHDFDLRATHARTLLPAASGSVSFGFVLV